MSVNSNLNHVERIKFWCYKVLPLVYDDSLSYYELLCKVVAKLNEMGDIINALPEEIDRLIKEALKNYEIPLANETKIGGIRARAKGVEDTVEVKIDSETGFLYVEQYELPVAGTNIGGVKGAVKTDTDTIPVHIDSEGNMFVESYSLKIAGENIGGVKGAVKNDEDTIPVHIDAEGNMFVKPSDVNIATSTKIGGIKANEKTSEENAEVKIDPLTGFLYVKAGSSGGASVLSDWLNVKAVMTEQGVDFDTALDWCIDNVTVGGTIYIPSGEYYSTSSHTVSKKCDIVGGDKAYISITQTVDTWLTMPKNHTVVRNIILTASIAPNCFIKTNGNTVDFSNTNMQLIENVIITNEDITTDINSAKNMVELTGDGNTNLTIRDSVIESGTTAFGITLNISDMSNVTIENSKLSNMGDSNNSLAVINFVNANDFNAVISGCVFSVTRVSSIRCNDATKINLHCEGLVFKQRPNKDVTDIGGVTPFIGNSLYLHNCIFEGTSDTVGSPWVYTQVAKYTEIIGCKFPASSGNKPPHCFDLQSDGSYLIANNENAYYSEPGGLHTIQGDIARNGVMGNNVTALITKSKGVTGVSANVRSAIGIMGGFVTFKATDVTSGFVVNDDFVTPSIVHIPIYRVDNGSYAGYIEVIPNGSSDQCLWQCHITDSNFVSNTTEYRCDFTLIACKRKRSAV